MAEQNSKRRIFVVTAPFIVDTGTVSFKFMTGKGIPYNRFSNIANTFGYLALNAKGADYVDPFKLVRKEEGAIGDDGVKRWNLFIFKVRHGSIYTAGANETPDEQTEQGLVGLLEYTPDCVLLMHRDLFDRFEAAARIREIHVIVHHCDSELSTS